MIIKRLPEFDRDIKKLHKKFRTIEDDFAIFVKSQIHIYHELNIDNNGIVRISNLGIEYPEIYKAKKFACRSLKGKGAASGIRIIYAYFKDEDKVEFIEIYYKGDKENENRTRIKDHYS